MEKLFGRPTGSGGWYPTKPGDNESLLLLLFFFMARGGGSCGGVTLKRILISYVVLFAFYRTGR